MPTAHTGAFEAAEGGTLFLDEIGELQPAVQATLLGVLERRKVRRLGSRSDLAVDVRIVTATHRDLRAEVNRGGFRLDLFYRLAVVTLTIPPLRERPDDIALLVEHFLRDAGWDQPVASLISPPAMEALARHHFAGNVRELRNLVEAAVAMGEAPSVGESRAGRSPQTPASRPILHDPTRTRAQSCSNSSRRATSRRCSSVRAATCRGGATRAADALALVRAARETSSLRQVRERAHTLTAVSHHWLSTSSERDVASTSSRSAGEL